MSNITLPMKQKFVYAVGQVSDSIPFNLFYTYFLYFLTDVAGVPAALGGIISLITVLWDAVTDPIVGYLSDNSKSKYGRRRPFMLAAIGPMLVCTILMFTAVDFGEKLSFIYYALIGILFWSSYKTYVIPFFALGAELTQDFNERNTLRSMAGFFIYLSVWFVSAGPMAVLDRVLAAGGSEKTSWILSAAILGAVAAIGGLICWRFTRGKELADAESYEQEKTGSILSNYLELLKVKTIRRLLVVILLYCISFAIATAAFVYIMDTNLQLSAARQAYYWTCYSVITIVLIPLCNVAANYLGKKQTMLLFNLITVAGCLFYFLFGIESFTHLILFTIFWNIGNVCFWTIGYSLIYDCCELDEFIYGLRREGAITGFASFAQKLGSAIGMYSTGILLELFGYNGQAEIQSQEAMNGIITVNTAVPGMFVAIATGLLLLYPINKTNFSKLLEANKRKREGLDYSTEGLEIFIETKEEQ